MEYDIRIKVDADGRAAVQGIDRVRKSVKGVEDQSERSSREIERDSERISRGWIAAGAAIASLSAILIRVGAESARVSLEFQNNITQINTLVGVGVAELEGYREAILGLTDTGRGPRELADALFSVTSAGIQGQAALELLEASATAASLGLGETRSIALAAGAAVNAYGQENLAAADAVDILVGTVEAGNLAASELAPVLGRVIGIASELGVEFQEVGAFIAQFTRLGVNSAEATTGLVGILSGLLKPAAQSAEAFEQLGTSVEEVRRRIEEDGFITTLQDLSTQAQAAGVDIAQLFPNVRALSGFLGVFNQEGSSAADVLQQVSNSVGSLEERSRRALELDPGQRLAQIRAELEASQIVIGDLVIEGLIPLAEAVSSTAQAFLDLDEDAQRLVVNIGKLVVGSTGVIALVGVMKLLAPAVVAVGTALTGPLGLVALIAALTAAVILNKDAVDDWLLRLGQLPSVLSDVVRDADRAESALAALQRRQENQANAFQPRIQATGAGVTADEVLGFSAEEIEQELRIAERTLRRFNRITGISEETVQGLEERIRLLSERQEELSASTAEAAAAQAEQERAARQQEEAARRAAEELERQERIAEQNIRTQDEIIRSLEQQVEALELQEAELRRGTEGILDYRRAQLLAADASDEVLQRFDELAENLIEQQQAINNLTFTQQDLQNAIDEIISRLPEFIRLMFGLGDAADEASDAFNRFDPGAFQTSVSGFLQEAGFSESISNAAASGLEIGIARGLNSISIEDIQEGNFEEIISTIGTSISQSVGRSIGSAIGGPIGGAIGDIVGQLIGDALFGESFPKAQIRGTNAARATDVGTDFIRETALGEIEFAFRDIDEAAERALTEAFLGFDQALASFIRDDLQLAEIEETLSEFGVSTRSDGEDIGQLLQLRFDAVLSTFDSFIQGIVEVGITLEEQVQRLNDIIAIESEIGLRRGLGLNGSAGLGIGPGPSPSPSPGPGPGNPSPGPVLPPGFDQIPRQSTQAIQSFNAAIEGTGDVADVTEPSLQRTLEVIQELQIPGETLGDTFDRLRVSTALLDDAVALTGANIGETREDLIRFGSDLTEAFGGIEQLSAALSNIFSTFFTEEEALGIQADQSRARAEALLNDLGVQFDESLLTVQGFRQLFDELFGTLSPEDTAILIEAGDEIARFIGLTEQLGGEIGTTLTDSLLEPVRQLASIIAELEADAQLSGLSDFQRQIVQIRIESRETVDAINEASEAAEFQGDAVALLGSSYDQTTRRIQEAIAQLTAAGQDIAAQLFGTPLDQVNEEIRILQEELGLSGDAFSNISDQAAQARQRLLEFADSLLIGNLSPLNQGDQLAEALSQLQSASAAGDAELVQQLARQVLGIARDRFASGQEFNDIFNQVQSIVRGTTPRVDQPQPVSIVSSPALEELFLRRDEIEAEQQRQQDLLLGRELAQIVADLAGEGQRTFEQIAETLGFDLSELAEVLGLDSEGIQDFISNLQVDTISVADSIFDMEQTLFDELKTQTEIWQRIVDDGLTVVIDSDDSVGPGGTIQTGEVVDAANGTTQAVNDSSDAIVNAIGQSSGDRQAMIDLLQQMVDGLESLRSRGNASIAE